MSAAVVRRVLDTSHQMLSANVATLTLDEALFAAGGYRSILGVLKHIGGWLHVYRSYAFDDDPKHWNQTSWPRGMRDTVEPSTEYVAEVVAWIDAGFTDWEADLAPLPNDAYEAPRPTHWGGSAPLGDIVVMIAHHVAYHTGELNMLLSISRGEAWEWGEEVEENHIDTYGHGVRGPWMNDEVAKWYQERLRAAHDARLGSGR